MPKNYHYNTPPMPVPCHATFERCAHLGPPPPTVVEHQTLHSMFGPVSYVRAPHPHCL
jgi:hypothetical protein